MTSPPEPYLIRPVAPGEYDAWVDAVCVGFDEAPSPEELALERRLTELDRTLAAFDGETITGTATALSLRMCVPGGLRDVAGVTAVTVLPSHRRRGVLRGLMARQLADVHEGGEAVAALSASESSIYGRFGYGRASDRMSLRLRRGEGAFIPQAPVDPGLRVRLADPEKARPELARVYDALLTSRPGLFARDDAWWDKALHDPARPGGSGAGPLRCVVVEDGGGPRGYALFTVRHRYDEDSLPDSEVRVRELFAVDPAAYAACWRHLLDRDLVGTVVARNRPADDPLLRLLADPRRARTRSWDGLWVRLVDVDAALAGRAYSRPVDTVLDVVDELCPWNTGRWRLSGDESGATCERTTEAPEVFLTVGDLGAAYLGDARLAAAAAAGQVRELRPGALRVLAAATSWDPRPWCPLIF